MPYNNLQHCIVFSNELLNRYHPSFRNHCNFFRKAMFCRKTYVDGMWELGFIECFKSFPSFSYIVEQAWANAAREPKELPTPVVE